MEGRSFPGAFERRKKFLYVGEIFMRNLKSMQKKGLVNGQLFPYGALLRNLEGARLLGLLRGKENAYLGSFFLDPEDIKIKVWRPPATLVSNRAPLS
jgi:hypothetical protein